MKNKPTWILVAFLANLGLLPLVVGPPEGRAQQRGGEKSAFFPCCKSTTSGHRYCCYRCCILVWNCRAHENCQKPKQT